MGSRPFGAASTRPVALVRPARRHRRIETSAGSTGAGRYPAPSNTLAQHASPPTHDGYGGSQASWRSLSAPNVEELELDLCTYDAALAGGRDRFPTTQLVPQAGLHPLRPTWADDQDIQPFSSRSPDQDWPVSHRIATGLTSPQMTPLSRSRKQD